MEIQEGNIDYNAKDELGNVLSPEAAYHMGKYRLRCQSCQGNFCSECGVQPYHLGKTCEAFKQHKNAKKCRFCDDELGAIKGNSCRKKDCVALKALSCSKTLACGH